MLDLQASGPVVFGTCPSLPVKLAFALPLNHPREGGLPDPNENEALAPVEDLIVNRVLSVTRGIHVLTLTTGVMKELVFYVPAGVDIGQLHAGLRAAVASHEVQCMAAMEPAWDSYRCFVR